jgi:hypothetical protein
MAAKELRIRVVMRKTEGTSQDVPTRSEWTSSKETFGIGYYFVYSFLSCAETRKEGRGEKVKR